MFKYQDLIHERVLNEELKAFGLSKLQFFTAFQ